VREHPHPPEVLLLFDSFKLSPDGKKASHGPLNIEMLKKYLLETDAAGK